MSNNKNSIIQTVNNICNASLLNEAKDQGEIGAPLLERLPKKTTGKTSIFNPDVYAPLPFPFSPQTPEYMPEVGKWAQDQENSIAQYLLNKKTPEQRQAARVAQAAMVDQPHGQYDGPEDEAPWNTSKPEVTPEFSKVPNSNLPDFMKPFNWKNISARINKQDNFVKMPGPDLQTSKDTQMSDASRWAFPTSRNVDFSKEDEEQLIDLQGPDEQGIYTVSISPTTEKETKGDYRYDSSSDKWVKDVPFPSVSGVDPTESPHGYEPIIPQKPEPKKSSGIIDPFETPRGQYVGPEEEAPWNKEKMDPARFPGMNDPAFATPEKPKQPELTGSPSPYAPSTHVWYSPVSDPKEQAARIAAETLGVPPETVYPKVSPDIAREVQKASLQKQKQNATPEQTAMVMANAKRLGVEPWSLEQIDASKKSAAKNREYIDTTLEQMKARYEDMKKRGINVPEPEVLKNARKRSSQEITAPQDFLYPEPPPKVDPYANYKRQQPREGTAGPLEVIGSIVTAPIKAIMPTSQRSNPDAEYRYRPAATDTTTQERPATQTPQTTPRNSNIMITKMTPSGDWEQVPADLSNEQDLRRIQPGSVSYEQLSPEDKARRDALKESIIVNDYCGFITEMAKKGLRANTKSKKPLTSVKVDEPTSLKPGTQWAPPEGYKGKIVIKNVNPVDTGLFSPPKSEPVAPATQPVTSPSKLRGLGTAAKILGGIAGGALATVLGTSMKTPKPEFVTLPSGIRYTHDVETGKYTYYPPSPSSGQSPEKLGTINTENTPTR